MYRLTIVCVDVLDHVEISAALSSMEGEPPAWSLLASVQDLIPCSQVRFHDPLSTMLDSVRLWSEMTIQR